MIQHSSNTRVIADSLKDYAMDAEVCKALGEPLLCHPKIEFLFWIDGGKVTGFIGYQVKKDHVFLRYAYTKPKSRGNGIFSKLLEEMEETVPLGIKTIKAVATSSALHLYLARGYKVTKGYIKFHKIQKQINND